MTDIHEQDPFAAALFSALSQTHDLDRAIAAKPARSNTAPPVTIQALARSLLAAGGMDTRSADMEGTLRLAFARPDTRAMAEALLARLCLAGFPTLAAADSGTVTERAEAGFRLRLAPSLEPSGPVYLLVEHDLEKPQPGPLPRLLIAIPPDAIPDNTVPKDRAPVVIPLPEGGEFPLQLLFDAEAPVPHLFRNPYSRFFLA